MNPGHTMTSYFSKTHFNIIPLSPGLPSCLFPIGFHPPKPCMYSSSPSCMLYDLPISTSLTCYEYIFKFPYSTIKHGVQNTIIAKKEKKNEYLLSFESRNITLFT
jgi:hypothetical protein